MDSEEENRRKSNSNEFNNLKITPISDAFQQTHIFAISTICKN